MEKTLQIDTTESSSKFKQKNKITVKFDCLSNLLSNIGENELDILSRLGACLHKWNVILLHIHKLQNLMVHKIDNNHTNKKNPRKPNHPTSCLDINQTSCHSYRRNPHGVLASTHHTYLTCNISNFKTHDYTYIGSRPNDHYFRSVCPSVCLGLVVSPRI